MVNKMFCNNCGNKLPENSKFCGHCGAKVMQEIAEAAPVAEAPVVEAPVVETPVVAAPVAEAPVAEAPVVEAPVVETPVAEAPVVEAPVAEAPVEEAPVAEAPESDFAQFEEAAQPKKKKSKKKLLAWLIPVTSLVVAAAVFVVLIFGPLQGWWLKNFGSAKDYRNYVQGNSKEMITGVLSDTYGSALSLLSGEATVEGGADVTMKLNLGEKTLDMVEQLTEAELGEKLDLSWMSSVGMTMSSNVKGSLQQVGATLNLGEAELAVIDCIMNMEEGKLFFAILNLSDKYIEMDLNAIMDMAQGFESYGPYNTKAVASKDYLSPLPSGSAMTSQSMLMEILQDPDLIAALPTAEELDKLLIKYADIILDSFDNVKKSTKNVSVGDVKQKLTVLETTIGPDDVLSAAEAVLEAASKDKQIKDIITDIVGYIEDKMGMGGMIDADDIYDMFQMGLEEALDALGDIDPDDMLEEMGMEDMELVLTDYVDSNHQVVGQKIVVADQEVLRYIEVQKGNNIAYELNAADMVVISGEGTRKKNVTNAVYTISVQDMEIMNIELVDFSSKDNKLNGKIRFAPSDEIMEPFMDGFQLPAEIAGVIGVLEPKLELGFVTTDKTTSMEMNVLTGNDLLVGVSFSTTMKDATAIKLPKNTVDITDEDAMEDFANSINVDKFIEDLEDAGIPISRFMNGVQ